MDMDITVSPADDPKKLRLGWTIEERIGPYYLPSKDNSCYDTDKADEFLGHCGKELPPKSGSVWTCVPQLDFLWGQPWNNLALNYVMGLRPSYIRVTDDMVTADARTWRVTVYLESDKRTIRRIEQECEVGAIGADCGQDLGLKLKQQKTGKKIEPFDASCCIINDKAIARVEVEASSEKKE